LRFEKYSTILSQKHDNTVIIDNVFESYKELEDVLNQLREHIQQNIIKVINRIFVFKFIIKILLICCLSI
jgi:hypothetical protein